MGFFDIGIGEILMILVVAVIIWGPRRIPEIGRTIGKVLRTLKKASSDLTTELTKEIDSDKKDHPPQQKGNQ
jgi:sec-independent protein translocase protein TatA